jgi:cell division protein FtsB
VAKARAGRRGARSAGGKGFQRLPPKLRILIYVAAAAAVLSFAIEGGEYGTSDLVKQRSQLRQLGSDIESLRTVVDSLERHRERLVRDSAMQERIAREEFGMVRGDRELLYRFAEPAKGGEVAEPRVRP